MSNKRDDSLGLDPLTHAILIGSQPPYMCKCGREMGGTWGVVKGKWTEIEPGCQPGYCLKDATR